MKTCSYKGRTYRLVFSGMTRFGMKAKLAFMDGSKEFWVNLDLISDVTGDGPSYAPQAASGAGRRRVCLCDDPTNNICPVHG